MTEANLVPQKPVFVPNFYRQVLFDDTDPEQEVFVDRYSEFLGVANQPRVHLFTQNEALELDNVAAKAVNEAINTKLPPTIFDEIDVITSGMRAVKRSLKLQVVDARLAQERQPILDAAYASYGRLPLFFRNFCWEIDLGTIKRGVDWVSVPSRLERFRPGSIKLKKTFFKNQ